MNELHESESAAHVAGFEIRFGTSRPTPCRTKRPHHQFPSAVSAEEWVIRLLLDLGEDPRITLPSAF